MIKTGKWLVRPTGRVIFAGAAMAVAAAAVGFASTQDSSERPVKRSGVRCPSIGPADFNGDGRRDLVVAGPQGRYSGFVTVVYGGSGRKQTISQATPGIPGEPGDDDRFGGSLASADFNGDGRSDLVIAFPFDRGRPKNVSRLVLVYGGRGGLSSKAVKMDVPGESDVFTTLTAGDFDCDGHPDLAVELRGEVRVYHRLGAGDLVTGKRLQHGLGVRTAPVTTASDLTGDGYPDLLVLKAVHTPDNEWSRRPMIYKGSGSGLGGQAQSHSRDWSQGSEMTMGDLNGDGTAEMVSAGYDGRRVQVTSVTTAGRTRPAIMAHDYGPAGTYTGLIPAIADLSLAVGDFNGDGMADVAVRFLRPNFSGPGPTPGGSGPPTSGGSSPGPTSGGSGSSSPSRERSPEGFVAVMYGGRSGLTAQHAQWLSPYCPGTRSRKTTPSGVFLGNTLSPADVNGDRRADLTIGMKAGDDTLVCTFVGSPEGVRTAESETFRITDTGVPPGYIVML